MALDTWTCCSREENGVCENFCSSTKKVLPLLLLGRRREERMTRKRKELNSGRWFNSPTGLRILRMWWHYIQPIAILRRRRQDWKRWNTSARWRRRGKRRRCRTRWIRFSWEKEDHQGTMSVVEVVKVVTKRLWDSGTGSFWARIRCSSIKKKRKRRRVIRLKI